MSYRKPVPIYVPSPPPSPDPSAAVEAASPPPPPPPSLVEPAEVPPLPVNWRDVLVGHSSQPSQAIEPTEQANTSAETTSDAMERSVSELPPPVPSKDDIAPVWIKKEDQDADFSLTDISQDISQIEFVRPRYISQDTDGVSNHSRPSINGPRVHTRQRKRSLLRQQYRPPTPPLPSLKRSAPTPQPLYTPTTEDMTFSSQVSSHYHGSETLLSHSFDGLDRHHIPAPIYPFKTHVASSSLRISPSFNTEKTMVSINTNHSGGWRSGMGSCDTGANSCPTLLIPHNLDDRFKFSKPSPQADTVSCWSGLEVWMKKIGNLVAHHKGR
ncbi:hypothetical protein BJ165DRAFT_1520993 [Panaeolus papilionaceus]|nr:hypothetical protein BJ165DRAFT_1520993 [Panaeolus papilionaceus]